MTETTNTLPAYEYRCITCGVRRDADDPQWWVFQCLDLPGVLSQGESMEAAFAMGYEALDAVLDHYAECGEEPDWRPAIASYSEDFELQGRTLRRAVGERRWGRMP